MKTNELAHSIKLFAHHKPTPLNRKVEAIACVNDLAMTVLPVNRLVAGHHHEKKSSKHVLEKLKFIRIGDVFYEPTSLYHPTYELCPEKKQKL